MTRDSHRNEAQSPYLRRRPSGTVSSRIRPRERPDAAMAPVQRGIWIASSHQLYQDPYLVIDFSRVHGPLDIEVLRACFTSLVQRHEALRIAFTPGEKPVQTVSNWAEVNLELHDLSDDANPEESASRVMEEMSQRSFDLTKGPLWRVAVVRLGPEEHLLLLTIHHLICDEWSLNLIHRGLETEYAARANRPSPTRSTTTPYSQEQVGSELGYGDFAEWQAARFASSAGERSLAYWRKAMDGIPHELDLPADYAQTGSLTHKGHTARWTLTDDENQRFFELANRLGASPFIVMVTLFGVVLARHSSRLDLAFGTAMSGRPNTEAETMIGHFINLLPIPVRLRDDPTFAEAVNATKMEFLGLLDHQDIAFDRLVSELGAGRSDLRMPLCQANVSWSEGDSATWKLGPAWIEPIASPHDSAKSEIMLSGGRSSNGLEFALIGESGFFRPDTVHTLMDHFRQAAHLGWADSTQNVSAIDLAGAAEHEALARWSESEQPADSNSTLDQLFAKAAVAYPDLTAVTDGEASLTYKELDSRSDAWASRLHQTGVTTDSVVGVAMPRSVERVAAVLGILKTGAAYMALNPAGPADYNAFCIANAGVVAVATTSVTTDVLGDIDCPLVVSDEVDDPTELTSGYIWGSNQRRAPNALAFVSFTSGSTGTPKCVGITHQNLARIVYRSAWAPSEPGRTFVHLTSLGFDISALELWGCLLHGGQLVIPPDHHLDIPDLAAILRGHGVTTVVTTTALFNQLVEQDLEALSGVETILVGGEAAVPSAFNRVVSAEETREMKLFHCYGPTENTCVTTSTVISEAVGARASIGTPVEGTTVHILGPDLERVPVGVVGELYTGGIGVSRGYLNDAGLTADRYLPDPYSGLPGARMYRTGDAARWRADGQLEFVGRMDRQVKVRGFRIEPGEIEAKMSEHPAVSSAAVVVRAGSGGQKQLVGYFVPAEGTDLEPALLRSFVAGGLPEHMVPSIIASIERIPMTLNGKLDREALPDPLESTVTAGDRLPSTPTEALLAEVWSSVLDLDQVGIDQNFFELGGDSLLSIRIAARVRESGVTLSSKDLFAAQTIAELAALIDERGTPASRVTVDPAPGGEAVLSPIQQWFVDTYGAENHFNQSVWLQSSEPLDETLLQDAFTALVHHHAALRLRLREVQGAWTQSAAPVAAGDVVTVVDFQGSAAEREATIERESTALQRSMDVGEGALFRALLVIDDDGQDDLILIAHHLGVDTVSWEVLVRHLETAYRQLESGMRPKLPAETLSFVDWTAALNAHAVSDEGEKVGQQWLSIDQRCKPILTDRPHDTGQVAQVEDVWAELDVNTTRDMLRHPVMACSVDIKSVLLTSLARTLADWTGQSQWVIDLEEHGRDALDGQVDLSETVGWFTAMFPVGLTIDVTAPITQQLTSIHTQLRAQPPGYTYGLTRYTRDNDTRSITRPELSFNYHGQMAEGTQESLLRRKAGGIGGDINPELQRPNKFEMNSSVENGTFRMRLSYPVHEFALSEMQSLVDRYMGHCQAIAEACGKRNEEA